MAWKPTNNAGYILEENRLPSEASMTEAATFLSEVTETFVEACTTFCQITEDLPFAYKERQVQSVLLPAIAKVAKAVFVEQPITRGTRQNRRAGLLDYWIYVKPFVFLMELKHAWFAFEPHKRRDRAQKGWQAATAQLRSISKAEARGLCIHADQALKMSLLIAPCYQDSIKADTLQALEPDQIADIHQQLIATLSPPPNWSAVWALNKELQLPAFDFGTHHEFYPCVSLLAHIKSL